MIAPPNLFIPRYLKYDLADNDQINTIVSKMEGTKLSK